MVGRLEAVPPALLAIKGKRGNLETVLTFSILFSGKPNSWSSRLM